MPATWRITSVCTPIAMLVSTMSTKPSAPPIRCTRSIGPAITITARNSASSHGEQPRTDARTAHPSSQQLADDDPEREPDHGGGRPPLGRHPAPADRHPEEHRVAALVGREHPEEPLERDGVDEPGDPGQQHRHRQGRPDPRVLSFLRHSGEFFARGDAGTEMVGSVGVEDVDDEDEGVGALDAARWAGPAAP